MFTSIFFKKIAQNFFYFSFLFTFFAYNCIIYMVNLMKKYITYSEQETENLGYSLAKKLNNNSIIVLTGNLGTGKTRFMRGIAKYFGIENEVSSPTFTIVNEYTPKLNTTIQKIFHFDVYRLNGPEDFEDSIGTDYFNNGLCIIEWGEIIEPILPSSTIYITIESTKNENERIIHIKGDI